MPKFHYTAHIDAPPQRVFDVASNIPNAANTIRGITNVEMVTDGPVGVGTTWKETRVMFGKEHTEILELTGFDPPRSYAASCGSCGILWHRVFHFTPESGGTRVDIDMEGKPLNLMARVIGTIMTPMMRKAMKTCVEGDLQDLKIACEGGEAATGQAAPA